jgi:hypothetical protein
MYNGQKADNILPRTYVRKNKSALASYCFRSSENTSMLKLNMKAELRGMCCYLEDIFGKSLNNPI